MTLDKKPATIPGLYTFSEVVDEACEKLMDRQIKHSIRKIQEMDERLAGLEQELEDFLFSCSQNTGI
jgi:hypothetical protein